MPTWRMCATSAKKEGSMRELSPLLLAHIPSTEHPQPPVLGREFPAKGQQQAAFRQQLFSKFGITAPNISSRIAGLFSKRNRGQQGISEQASSNSSEDEAPGAAMDVYYVSHGSPMLPFDEIPARDFFQGMAKLVKQKPKAILVISGHWETREPVVSSTPHNSTIHDFYGFPRELYQLKYNAPGAPHVAQRVKELLHEAGFKQASEDPKRGLDHGAWIPLWLSYPNADIPVCQLSIQSQKDGEHHYRLGRALAPLTKEGVLIIGSGTTTHNLRKITATVPGWAKAFDEWLYDCLLHERYDEVVHYLEKAPHAKLNHPTPDHFLPLIVALGAAGEGAKAEAIHRSWHASLSMASYVLKPAL